jgi:predicted dehydrogenase
VIGIGIVGFGTMGRRMAAQIETDSRFRIVAGYDPVAPDPPVAWPMLASAADVAAHRDVNCLYIASPPNHHLDAIAAAASAKRAIFVEKPLAATARDAHIAMRTAQGLQAAVNFPFATSPAASDLAECVRRGSLGTITEARLTLRFAKWPRPWQAGAAPWLDAPEQGGFWREVGSHFLFLAGRLFGDARIEEVRITRGAGGVETEVDAELRYAHVRLTVDAAVSGSVDDTNRFELFGKQGRAALVDWQAFERDGVRGERRPPRQLDALAAMLGGQQHPLATLAEAASVVALVEAMLD